MAQPKRKEKSEEPGGPEAVPSEAAETWSKAAPLSRTGKIIVAAMVLLFNVPLIHYFLFRPAPAATVTLPYQQDFGDPAVVERDFFSTGGLWRVESGQLVSPGVKNNPLWLKAKLPQNVAVEFDVRSMSQEGDIKAEIFGDGSDHATGYVLIHGGWNNSISIIARLDEHGPSLGALQSQAAQVAAEQHLPTTDVVKTRVFRESTAMRVEANPYPVTVGRTYHWRIERRGSLLTWFIDGKEFMRFDDPFPLAGPGHDRFAFSSWESQLYFDALSVQAL